MKTAPITKAEDLISTLKNDVSLNLFWHCGARPSAPGNYSVGGVSVYASAVAKAKKLGALRCVTDHYSHQMYRLTLKCRMEA